MPGDPEKRYWDASAFLALIKNEPDRADVCEAIVTDARAGRCAIYTSMITLVEVVKRKRGPAVDKETEQTIAAFFRNEYIKLVPVDHTIATRARRLIWDFPWLGARDAIHLATAMQLHIDVVEHYDDDDLGRVAERVRTEKLPGFPELRHPRWVGQPDLPEVDPPAGPPRPPDEAPAPCDVAPSAAPAEAVPADPGSPSPTAEQPKTS